MKYAYLGQVALISAHCVIAEHEAVKGMKGRFNVRIGHEDDKGIAKRQNILCHVSLKVEESS